VGPRRLGAEIAPVVEIAVTAAEAYIKAASDERDGLLNDSSSTQIKSICRGG
jgi:hypothetical protein